MKGWESHSSAPFKKGGRGWDRVQTGLSFAGLIFPQADALNAAISTTRAGVAKIKGDDEEFKKHRQAAIINAAAIVPGVGESIKAAKGGKLLVTKGTKQVDDALKAVDSSGVVDKVAAGANLGYWSGTADQISKDVMGE